MQIPMNTTSVLPHNALKHSRPRSSLTLFMSSNSYMHCLTNQPLLVYAQLHPSMMYTPLLNQLLSSVSYETRSKTSRTWSYHSKTTSQLLHPLHPLSCQLRPHYHHRQKQCLTLPPSPPLPGHPGSPHPNRQPRLAYLSHNVGPASLCMLQQQTLSPLRLPSLHLLKW